MGCILLFKLNNGFYIDPGWGKMFKAILNNDDAKNHQWVAQSSRALDKTAKYPPKVKLENFHNSRVLELE